MSDLSPAPTGQSAQHSPGQTTRSTGRQTPTNEQQDARMYAAGDADPTWSPSGPAVPCDAVEPGEFGFVCTWPKGHTHPQHVAGDSETVCSVWPVLAAVSAAAPDEREALLAQAWEAAQARYPGESGLTDASRGAFVVGWSSCLDAALAARPAPVVSGEAVAKAARALIVIDYGEADADHLMNVEASGRPRRLAYRRVNAVLAALGVTVADAPAAERAGCPWHSPAADDEGAQA